MSALLLKLDKKLNVAYNHSAGNSKADKYKKGTLVKIPPKKIPRTE